MKQISAWIVCLLLLIHEGAPNPRPINLGSVGNVFTSSRDIGVGIVSNAGKFLPTPKGLFESGKNVIAGYPFEFVSTSINAICSAAVSTNAVIPKITPDIHKMQFQLRTPCKKYSFPLMHANEMWKSPEFDYRKKTVILATGWTTTVNETDTISQMAQAYHCRGDVNFIAVDVASYVDTLYTWSALNTEQIGENIGKGLMQLSEITPLENIHLIGHSLGAHIVGAAGRTFNYLTGKQIPRITGLDPAKPCFNEGENLSGLLRGDAQFIDVIHSNPGVLGKRDPMGDVDFYPGGLDPLPTGCLSVVCAHERAWLYYTESVYPGNENNFMAVRCSSLTRLKNNKCPGRSIPMGYASPNHLKGNYFLDVNGEAPFGMDGNKDRDERNKNCGLCPNSSGELV
ncbi:vitellogenin-1-like [Eupeodes corollae]|uniref:vitellogenin-1-like n=1 Tax=Eupeodes corollae TaxID=290404 RepID=UPI002493570E|nr:vitellogenin-1-like [Eupeodes corollae]